MKTVKLSEVKNFTKMNHPHELIDFMLDNNYTTLVNDYGSRIEFDISEIEDCWEFINKWRLKLIGL